MCKTIIISYFIFTLFLLLLFLIFFLLRGDSPIVHTWGSVVFPVIWFVSRGTWWGESS